MTYKGNSMFDACCALTSMGLVLPLLFSWFVKFIKEVNTLLTQYTHTHK